MIKNIKSKLIYSKKYLIAKKGFNTKESFQCFYRKMIPMPLMLIDAVYRKDKNYLPEVILGNISFILMISMILMLLMKIFQERKK